MELASQFLRAPLTRRKMVRCVTHCAETATTVLDQFAGRNAQKNSATMALTATSQHHTAVALAQPRNVTTVRSGALSGTLSAVTTSTMSAAVSAHLTALMV